MNLYILMRFSKRTGKVDTVMTGITTAMMQLWALNNTSPKKDSIIIEQATGNVVFYAEGDESGFPKVHKNAGHCEQFGIPYEFIQSIKDDRF